MPSVLLELGFMDSVTDIKTILANDFADKCADAIVSVIVKRKGLKKEEEVMKKGETNLGIYIPSFLSPPFCRRRCVGSTRRHTRWCSSIGRAIAL